MIKTVTVTTSPMSDAYYFQIEIPREELLRLQEERFLGMTFKKNKYKFLNELREVISSELIKHFHALLTKNEDL